MKIFINNNWKKIAIEIVKIIISISIVLTLNVDMGKQIEQFNGNTILYIIEFIMIYYTLAYVMKNVNKRMLICTSILAFLGASIEVICYSIDNYKNLFGLLESYNVIVIKIISFLGYFFALNIINIIIYKKLDKLNKKIKEKTNEKTNVNIKKKNFFIYWAIIFICWVPYYLNYFPGLTTSDSMLQIYQSLGISELTTHHPLIHTMFIGIFMNLGKFMNNYIIGVAIYTIVQMLIMSFIFSVVLYIMKKRKMPKFLLISTILFYAIYPINPLFSLMMWKDILFAGIMLAYTICTYNLLVNTEEFLKSKKNIILFIFIMILLMFFRNNGLYVIILSLPFEIIIMRKKWKKILFMFLTSILIYSLINNTVVGILGIKKGEIREALSVPMQQLARVVSYHKDELSDEELIRIKKYINADNIEELYNPTISDPVKNHFNSQVFSDNKVDFIKIWLKLFIKYPTDYVESFLCNSYGYYYPEAKHWVANRTMEKDDILNLQTQPILKLKIVSKIDSLIEKRENPVTSMLFSIGFVFWIIIICLSYCIYNRRYKNIVVYIPIIMLWFTTLASPVFCEFRYVYSLITCLPIFVMTILYGINEKECSKCEKN